MAEVKETKTVLTIDTINSLDTIQKLRAAVKELRNEVNNAKVGSDKFEESQALLTHAQNNLANATKLGTTDLKKASESYNVLSRQMAELNQEYKATTDSLRREELAKQIKGINDRLKEMDAKRGVFGRNVGDYANQMSSAFRQTAGAAGAVIAPLQSVTGIMTTMNAHPLIATLGLIANIIFGITRAMQQSEEGAYELRTAMSGLNAVMETTTQIAMNIGYVLGQLGNVVSYVLGKLQQILDWYDQLPTAAKLAAKTNAIGWMFTSSWDIANKVMKETGVRLDEVAVREERNLDLAKRELELNKLRREIVVKNSEDELKASELRAKATDKENVAAKDRLEALLAARVLYEKIAKRNVELAELELKYQIEANKNTDSSTEALMAEAEAKAKVNREQMAYNNLMRELNAQIHETSNQIRRESGGEAGVESNPEVVVAQLVNDTLLAMHQDMLDAKTEMDRSWRAQYLADEAVFLEDLENFEREHSNDTLKLNKQMAANDKALADEERKQMNAKVGAASNMMGALAELSGENTKTGKAFAVAKALIDMYSGATVAFSVAQELGPILGPIIGGINAAAVVAMGMANIRSINSVDTSGNNSGAGISAPAVVAPPAVIQQVPVVRSLTETAASSETTLNQIATNTASTQRVVLVYSDVEEAANHVEVVANETEF